MNGDQSLGRIEHASETDRRTTYAAVIAFEVFVVAALWAFGRYFGSL